MVGGSERHELIEDERRRVSEHLQMGTEMMVYQQRAERLTVQVIMESMQVALIRSDDSRIVRLLDIFEFKEVRQWETCKDFQRFNEKLQDSKTCFTIFYGSEFILKSLSLKADSVEDAEKWLTGLELLRQETLAAHTPEIIESMYSVDQSKKNSITLKELKSLLPQMNFAVPGGRFLEDRFVDVEAKDYSLDIQQFHKFYNFLIFENQKMVSVQFISFHYLLINTDSPESSVVPLYDFQNFLLYRQKEAKNLNQIQELMTIFIDDTMRKTNYPVLTVGEFLSFLFSKENSIWNEKFSEICPLDMNNPLSHYWINSSHNTYLTGDQLRSDSSTEAYVRCLRLGCRCIELDCWNGPEEPVIYHGRTMTSKIKFKDVVKAINDHAFATSEYPVVLSIEEHCDIKQQKMMAQMLRDAFQDKLLTEPLEPEADDLPSPNQLKGKIIIKVGKKQIRKAKENRVVEKEGELCIWDPIDKRFYRHDCVISDNKLYYSEEKSFLCRITAEKLLHDFCKGRDGKDGTFLVRESKAFIRNYSISLWTSGRIQHYKIFCSSENGQWSFYLTIKQRFPSMCALIKYYTQNLITYDRLNLRLNGFLPRLNFVPSHQIGWFYSNLSQAEAEDYLLRIPRDGAFLIRQREEPDHFTLSIRVEGDVEHYLIYQNNSKYVLADAYEFGSLEDLVSCFRDKVFYGKTKLRYPVTPQLVDRFCMVRELPSVYKILNFNTLFLVDFNGFSSACKAKHARPLVVTLLNRENLKLIEFTCEIVEQVDEWYQVLLNIIQNEQSLGKAVLNQTFHFIYYSILHFYDLSENYNYKEVRSIPDNMVPKEGNESTVEKSDSILEYNRKALTRVYPCSGRVDSSNFDPCPSWRLGCQMVALNFQTADKFMQLNSALFSLNGGTGYVLKPEWMRDPTKKKPAKQTIRIRVMAARHLPSPDHIVSPFVQVELWPYTGGQADDYSFKTTLFKDNGLNPVWLGQMNPPKCFKVDEPDLAFLRFVVFEEDTFSDAKFLAQATFPIRGIRQGYRSVPLKNRFSENLELSSLLVHVQQVEGSSCICKNSRSHGKHSSFCMYTTVPQ
uniref:Phosphoinositide phospholipase C n=1 Tax=Cyprinus carpio TaxID=7962 RepID=A0A8C2BC84_CYPCA